MKRKFSTISFIRITFIIIYCSLVCCQNNDTQIEENLTADKLEQTSWKGTIHCNGWTYEDWNIGIQFINRQVGGVSYYPVNTSPNESMKNDNFTYSLNDKLIFFRNSGILEGGPWTIILYDSQHLILKQNISNADPNNVVTMKLSKVK